MEKKGSNFIPQKDGSISNVINLKDIDMYSSAEGINPLKLFIYKFGMFPNKLNFNGMSDEFSKKYKDHTIRYDINKFIKAITKKYPNAAYNLNRYCDEECATRSIYLTVMLEEEQVVAYIDTSDETGIIVYYNDEKYGVDVYKTYLKCMIKKAPPAERKKISLIIQRQNGYGLIESDVKQVEVNVAKHYNDDFKKADKVINEFINEPDQSGLVILNGVKGTGKTTYIRHLINSTSRRFIYLTKEMASALTDPSFITFLLECKGCVLVIEDCENLVAARNQGNASTGISNLLNMCDGLLSDVFNIKIIATFNEDIKKVDDALLRKGRLIYRYEFKELSVEKTNKLLKSLKINHESTEPMTLADIFNFEKEIGDVENKKRQIGFGV